jgi:Putative exporter of polyketide antibiotics
MNVYLFELRREARGWVVWTFTITAAFMLLMLGFFPIFMNSKQAMLDALAGFPPQFTAAFVGAMSPDTLFTYGGFYSFMNLYLSLAGACMACTFGFGIFAREKRSGCTDFLLSKPLSRGSIFAAKLLATLTLITAFGVIYIASAVAVYAKIADKPLDLGAAVLSAAGMTFTQLVFLAIAVFAAVFMRRIRTVSGAATAVAFAAFGIELLHNLTDEEKFKYLTPYLYFNVGQPFTQGGYEPLLAVLAAVLTAVLLSAAYLKSLAH